MSRRYWTSYVPSNLGPQNCFECGELYAARASREAEIFILRQQLLVLSRKSRARVRLRNLDRLVLVWL